MAEKQYTGHQWYIIHNHGEILYDGGHFSIAHFSFNCSFDCICAVYEEKFGSIPANDIKISSATY